MCFLAPQGVVALWLNLDRFETFSGCSPKDATNRLAPRACVCTKLAPVKCALGVPRFAVLKFKINLEDEQGFDNE